jgi:hypothetical protein
MPQTKPSAEKKSARSARTTRLRQMHRLLDDLEREFGPVDNETKAKVEALWQTASRTTPAR